MLKSKYIFWTFYFVVAKCQAAICVWGIKLTPKNLYLVSSHENFGTMWKKMWKECLRQQHTLCTQTFPVFPCILIVEDIFWGEILHCWFHHRVQCPPSYGTDVVTVRWMHLFLNVELQLRKKNQWKGKNTYKERGRMNGLRRPTSAVVFLNKEEQRKNRDV